MMKNVAIIGASGAIGQAFIDVFSQHKDINQVFRFARSPQHDDDIALDLTDEDSITAAARQIDCSLDYVIVATGQLHDSDFTPEKSLKALSQKAFEHFFAVNTIGPALIIKAFSPLLTKTDRSVMALLSARVGSITDNHLGGWYSYRASKAALNMVIKTASIELGRSNKKASLIGLHPGTVDSALSKPFQANIPKDKCFTPSFAVSQMMQVIDQIKVEDSGDCFAYDGKKIAP